MEKGISIGQGRTAEIFLWGEKAVLKLFRANLHSSVADSEIRVNELLRHLPVPAPRMLDVVEVEGRRGIVFERVEGESMLKQLLRRPWQVGRFASILAELHVKMHQAACDTLPPQKAYWEGQIRGVKQLTEAEKEAALSVLGKLPEGMQICHGDFHPDNVMMTAAGAVIIDWSNAMIGDAPGDVARTAMILGTGRLPNPLANLALRTLGGWFCAHYVREYLRLTGLSREAVEAWELPLYAARLLESLPEAEEEVVLRRVREILAKKNPGF